MRGTASLDTRRRRRSAAVIAIGVAASVTLLAVMVAADVQERDAPPEAARPRTDPSPIGEHSGRPEPAPSKAARSYPALSAQQIRDHPDATTDGEGDFVATASGAAARIWTVCLGDCTRATESIPGEWQTALEVSRDDFATGSLHALDLSEHISHVLADWYLVDASKGPTLVNARGQRRPLRLGTRVPVTGPAGPPVYSRRGLAYVDLRAGKVHAIKREGPGFWDWQGAADTWFWGTLTLVEDTTVTRQAVLWRRADDSFAVKVLPIGSSSGSSGMLRAGTPGTMAVVEHFAEPRRAHISTDYGASWQIREVPSDVESGGDLPDDWRSWPVG